MKLGKVDTAEIRRHMRWARHHSGRVARAVHRHGFSTRKRVIASLVVLAIVPIVLVQLFWSTTSLLPNTYVGSVNLSNMAKDEAATKLNEAYEATKVPVYFSDSDEVAVQPTLGNLGYTIDNEARVDAYSYPFAMRLVPYSLFWYQFFMSKGNPQVARSDEVLVSFVNERFGEDCEFEPVNGTVAYIDDELQAVEASRGGSCDPDEMLREFRGVGAQLDPAKITLAGTSIAPEVSTADAEAEYERLVKQLGGGVVLMVEDKEQKIEKKVVEPWIEYSVVEGKLVAGINDEKAAAWLSDKYGEKYTWDAGTTTIHLVDYAEKSQDTGKSGSALNNVGTIGEIEKDLQGAQKNARLMIDSIAPAIEYTREYSPSNATLSAVIKKFASSHGGSYGVKMVELSGERRNAEYNSTKTFITASTYKMFVAYSVLLQIEKGAMHWTDRSAGGQTVSTCFDKMLKLSDNDCAVALFLKVSYPVVMADAHAIGATHTNFVRGKDLTSTAADEAHLLSLLYTGQILSQQASRDRWIETMKGNVYVSGIPTGIPGVVVADKVGFMDGLLHDAAIVYSKKGDYVLIIMTNGSSWGNIAALAKEIEAAR